MSALAVLIPVARCRVEWDSAVRANVVPDNAAVETVRNANNSGRRNLLVGAMQGRSARSMADRSSKWIPFPGDRAGNLRGNSPGRNKRDVIPVVLPAVVVHPVVVPVEVAAIAPREITIIRQDMHRR